MREVDDEAGHKRISSRLRSARVKSDHAPVAEPGGRPPAPGPLRIVQEFINSNDREAGLDELDSTEALARWLLDHQLLKSRVRPSHADLQRAREFRELLRALALANNNLEMTHRERLALNKQLARLNFVAVVDDRDGVHLESAESGVDEALAEIAGIVVAEMLRGRWGRLKACGRGVCRWVFYDQSKNAAGTWCSMSICGSRTKAKSYYRRRHATAEARVAGGPPATSPGRDAAVE